MGPRHDAALARRLLWHEARVHAVPDRVLRDLGDAILLYDRSDAEPFWNRLAAVRWPADPVAFEQRLTEIRVLFASIGRQPHIWLLPPFDAPPDLFERLVANGYEDVGAGCLMAAPADAAAAAAARALDGARRDGNLRLERFSGLTGAAADGPAEAIVRVLLTAFGVDGSRRSGVMAETRVTLGDPRFTHYLVTLAGTPVAACRRATFDGISYLSSIGTVEAARGRGLGRLVTATAMIDAVAARSEWVHLGVFADNAPAIALYERLGFAFVGEPGPDMILVR